AEIPAPATGVLSEIKVPEGSTVQVNTVVGVIDGDGSGAKTGGGAAQASKGGAAQAAPSTSQKTATTPAKEAGTTKGGAASTDGGAGAKKAEEQKSQRPAAAIPAEDSASFEAAGTTSSRDGAATSPPAREAAEEETEGDGQRIRSSPLVRRIAKEHGINLAQVPGSGLGGRITKEDIEGFVAQRPAAGKAGAAATGSRPATPSAQPQLGPYEVPGDVVPMSAMRKKIAERMVESKRTSPHVHTIYEVDLTRVAKLRTRVRAEWERRNGTKLTFMPFVARATVAAIRQYPIVNSSLEEGGIHYHRNIGLGMAVALDWGLIVPVIKNAEEKNFLGLQRAINDLSERARNKKLNPDEVTGGTFTITNPGSIGGLIGLPIIMQPQVA